MRTKDLQDAGISYRQLKKMIDEGYIDKIRYGYYQWQNEQSFSEIFAISSLFPNAILCRDSALMYYGYTDRTPEKWHIAVDSKDSRTKFKLDYIKIKVHYIEQNRLTIGVTDGIIDDITIKIYDRERTICDCLRYANSMDAEIYSTAIKRYVQDKSHNIGRLMQYAKLLEVEKKVRRTIAVWL